MNPPILPHIRLKRTLPCPVQRSPSHPFEPLHNFAALPQEHLPEAPQDLLNLAADIQGRVLRLVDALAKLALGLFARPHPEARDRDAVPLRPAGAVVPVDLDAVAHV